ncbi:hypothetical protein CR532_04635 (plasmid) [Candidatus Borreliella tachyglossi]|uniref:Uncharacterized protein n=1 Tax=Candidatus Borreliella tachyglossi TaxID=1964448 RepID=A0A2S1LYA3_9SPIR|nr:DUF1506 family protein [Candidatus Borreliella tachyglossi]AWG43287.1 hypothetical protein CR532_04635 [Candidatus Borreliella tachyglossi]
MSALKDIYLTVSNLIRRYEQPMFLLKKTLVKNSENATISTKIDHDHLTKFNGIFLPLNKDETVELFGSKIYVNERYAKVYTLDGLNFRPEEQVLVEKSFLEIMSISGYFQNEIGYTVLMVRRL